MENNYFSGKFETKLIKKQRRMSPVRTGPKTRGKTSPSIHAKNVENDYFSEKFKTTGKSRTTCGMQEICVLLLLELKLLLLVMLLQLLKLLQAGHVMQVMLQILLQIWLLMLMWWEALQESLLLQSVDLQSLHLFSLLLPLQQQRFLQLQFR